MQPLLLSLQQNRSDPYHQLLFLTVFILHLISGERKGKCVPFHAMKGGRESSSIVPLILTSALEVG